MKHTKRMATAQLWLLRVLALQVVANAVEQLDVTLLRVLLERVDKGPRHGSSSLASDIGVLPVHENRSAGVLPMHACDGSAKV